MKAVRRTELTLEKPLLVAADLHLGHSPAVEARLADLLDRLPRDIVCLFLGDVVDFWAEGPRYDMGAEYRILKRLRVWETYYLKGNRDFLIGPRWEEMTGGKVLGDEVALTSWGRKLLCLHGDALLKRDKRYQRWRLLARSRPFMIAAGLIGSGLAQRWAQTLRKGSRREVARKSEYEMSVPLEYADELASGFDLLVSGHTHRPGRQSLAGGAELITLGAWDEGAEVLLLDRRGPRLTGVDTLVRENDFPRA